MSELEIRNTSVSGQDFGQYDASMEAEKRQPEVHSEVEMLATEIEKLMKVTDVLTARLGIVTRPFAKSDEDPRLSAVPQDGTACELGQLIRSRRDNVYDTRRKIESLIDRLEV